MENRRGETNRFGTRGLGRAICQKFPFCFLLCLLFLFPSEVSAEQWKITSYCACVKCCGKSDGITASGKKAKYGMVACNWLPFGTKVKIEGLGVFEVADRGAKSQFGSKKNHIKHLDIYLPTHAQARKFGVKYLKVTVLQNGRGNDSGKVLQRVSVVRNERSVRYGGK